MIKYYMLWNEIKWGRNMIEIIRNVVLVIYVLVCVVLIILATIQAKDQSGAS